MKFQAKIFLAVLAILVATLLLNSVLSLASFEKLYVASLISTYEMVGKNLKRKIEQSLRFGKPLDKFKGMNVILTKTVSKNPEISFVAVGRPDGTILYQSKAGVARGKFRHPVPDGIELAEINTELFGNEYVTYLPLLGRTGETVGILNLTFSRNVVYQELKSMAGEDVSTLSIIVTASALCLFLLLSFLIVHPLRKKLVNISESIRWPSGTFPETGKLPQRVIAPVQNKITGQADISKTKNEVNRLHRQITDFILSAENNIDKCESIRNKRNELVDNLETIKEYDAVIVKILAQREDLSDSDRETLSEISRKSKILCREAFTTLEVPRIHADHANDKKTDTEQS